MRIRTVIGRCLYLFAKRMPSSDCRFKIGQKCFRRLCAKLIIDKCGKNVNVEKGATFPRSLILGDNSGLGKRCQIKGKTIIGDNVMMGPDVKIYTVNHNTRRTDIPMNAQGNQPERPVKIGNDVWIGDSVIILPGSVIGDGSIIGGGCVVRGEIPPYSVAIGNPATVIKNRKQN